METKSLNIELKADGPEGRISGYGAVFGNVDSTGDRIMPGAFKQSLENRKPKMLWQHNMADPIGVFEEFYEDDHGLYMEGKLVLGATRGRDAFALAEAGAIDGLSIGYMVPEGGAEMNGTIREIRQIDLFEVSMVTVPANPEATITGVKADLTPGDAERLLRANGYSRSQAKAFVAGGFNAMKGLRDAGALQDVDALRDAGVLDALEKLKSNLGVQ